MRTSDAKCLLDPTISAASNTGLNREVWRGLSRAYYSLLQASTG